MATVAIGDIHGNLAALEDLLAQLVPTLSSADTLVFLGDYIDRGPDTRGCLERIIRLQGESRFEVVGLLGNHEHWLLQTYRDATRHSWLIATEALETIASYSIQAALTVRRQFERLGPRLIRENLPLPYEAFFEAMPRDHLEFIKGLRPYHQTRDVLAVHGGVDGSPPELQDEQVLVWGPDGWPGVYSGEEAVVYGHWDNAVFDEEGWPRPRVGPNRTYGIDTISSGVLTAMRFPDERIFQSGKCL